MTKCPRNRLFSKLPRFSSANHHSAIAPFTLITPSWGVGETWTGSILFTFSHSEGRFSPVTWLGTERGSWVPTLDNPVLADVYVSYGMFATLTKHCLTRTYQRLTPIRTAVLVLVSTVEAHKKVKMSLCLSTTSWRGMGRVVERFLAFLTSALNMISSTCRPPYSRRRRASK
jgi:hypothetical protein